MRASEKNMQDTNQSHAWGFIEDATKKRQDPDVVARFERSPYYPVLKFDKGVVKHDGPSRWEED